MSVKRTDGCAPVYFFIIPGANDIRIKPSKKCSYSLWPAQWRKRKYLHYRSGAMALRASLARKTSNYDTAHVATVVVVVVVWPARPQSSRGRVGLSA